MDIAAILIGIAAVHLLAAASPGPTFFVVTSHALSNDRCTGLLVTLGVLCATLIWSTLAAAGLAAVVAQFGWLYVVLQIAGAAYLVYLGAKLLIGAWRKTAVRHSEEKRAATGWHAVRTGILTNIANPKTIAYYTSLFSVMIPRDAPDWLFFAAVGTALVVSTAWWTSVTLFFALPPIQRGYSYIRRPLDAVMGSLLILLGGRLLTSR